MGLFGFGKKNEGGLMDAIRCDETDFLIWKWRPAGQAANTTNKENAIRTGSSLNVRPGQAAVFLYPNTSGQYDVIMGPYNDVVKTDNMPILANIIGAAYAGGTPFQAEVYYINLMKGLEVPFTVRYFRVVPAEPQFKTYDVRVAIKGSLFVEVPAQPEFIKRCLETWGSNDTSLEQLSEKIKTMLAQEIQQVIANAPKDTGIFVMHFNSLIGELGKYIQARIWEEVADVSGVFAKRVVLSSIDFDEESEGYQRLKRVTEDRTFIVDLEQEKNALLAFDIQRKTMATDANIRNSSAARMADMQLDHQEDMLSRMRENADFAQTMQTKMAAQQASMMNEAAAHRTNLSSETAYIGAHQINVQADVMKTGLSNMGQMGAMNLGGGDGHMNPAGMMASMMMGTAVAGQMGNMMNNMGNTMNQQMQAQGATPPPMPGQQAAVSYFLNVNGQQFGPCDANSLMQMVQGGQINAQTMAWTQGMPQWAPLGTIPALAALFQAPQQTPPPMPNGGGMTPPPMPAQ
jgi:membrane protease subunit (stomatin/prohibitin family)